MNQIKSVSKTEDELRVSNYIILFDGSDLDGERFTKSTDFESQYTKSGVLHVDFEHGLDPDGAGMTKHHVLGYVDWKTAQVDDKGVFVERVLNRHARYMDLIEPLIEAGIVGTSSEAVPTETARDGKNIVKWPLMRDSLTVMPAEPRMMGENVISTVKSLCDAFGLDSKNYIKRDLKSNIEDANSLKEIEGLLRDEVGLSRSEAVTLVSRIKSVVHSDCEDEKKTAKDLSSVFENFNIKSQKGEHNDRRSEENC